MMSECVNCNGRGTVSWYAPDGEKVKQPCKTCDGTGSVEGVASTAEERWWETRRCPRRDDGPHVFGTEQSSGLGPNRCRHCDLTTEMLAGRAARAGLPSGPSGYSGRTHPH